MLARLLVLLLFCSGVPAEYFAKARPQEPASLRQARVFAETAAGFSDVLASVRTLAALADLMWQVDSNFSRRLVRQSLERLRSDSAEISQRIKALSLLAQHLASRDSDLAEQILEQGAGFEIPAKDKSEAYYLMARALAEKSPGQAGAFLNRSLESCPSPELVFLLHRIRRADPDTADSLFQRTLDQLRGQPVPDLQTFLFLGHYVYSSQPPGNGPDVVTTKFIAGVPVITLAFERPDASGRARASYLQTAAEILTKPIISEEQKTSYAAAALQLLPSIRQFNPEMALAVESALHSLTQSVPAELLEEGRHQALKKPGGASFEERVAQLDNPSDDLARNAECLVLAKEAASRGQLDLMEKIAGKARDQELGQSLKRLALYLALKKRIRNDDALSVEDVQKQLPQGLERASALLLLAQRAATKENKEMAGEAARAALKSVDWAPDSLKPWVMAAAIAVLPSDEGIQWMYPLMTAVNAHHLSSPYFSIRLQAGNVSRDFSLLDSPRLVDALQRVIADEPEFVAEAIERLKDEAARGDFMRAVVEALIIQEQHSKEQTTRPPSGPALLRVKASELAMRQAVIRKVMPVYPQASVRNKATGAGVAKVLIGKSGRVTKTIVLEAPDILTAKAVEKAAAQWVFEVTKASGEAVEVETYITFYFVIENGKGIVRDPKLPPVKKDENEKQGKPR